MYLLIVNGAYLDIIPDEELTAHLRSGWNKIEEVSNFADWQGAEAMAKRYCKDFSLSPIWPVDEPPIPEVTENEESVAL